MPPEPRGGWRWDDPKWMPCRSPVKCLSLTCEVYCKTSDVSHCKPNASSASIVGRESSSSRRRLRSKGYNCLVVQLAKKDEHLPKLRVIRAKLRRRQSAKSFSSWWMSTTMEWLAWRRSTRPPLPVPLGTGDLCTKPFPGAS